MSVLSLPMLLPSIIDLGGKLIDRVFPDPKAAAEGKLKLLEMVQSGELAQLAASTDIIKAGAAIVLAEANSQSWLARSWRPLVMLTFVSLIVTRWLGLAAPDLAPEEYLALWDIVRLGLGGYVIGRSVEKVAPEITKAIIEARGK